MLRDLDIVALIEDIFHRRGAESYLGEAITMSQHMLQAAARAERDNRDDEVVAAALLHDIGHYTNEFPEDALEQDMDNFHQNAGARVLEGYFSKRIVDCVKFHVDAKRYLCSTREGYYEDLSDASKHSLALQGGPYNEQEVEEFAKQDFLDDILTVRICDDLGKDASLVTPDFAHFRPLLEKVVIQPT
ncbi:MAG: putative HD phosphohydrolase [Gammaproteobacteria bacterium]|jgi:predicted HD phosphohydrolase